MADQLIGQARIRRDRRKQGGILRKSGTNDRWLGSIPAGRHFEGTVLLLLSSFTIFFIAVFVLVSAFMQQWLHVGLTCTLAFLAIGNGIYVRRTGHAERGGTNLSLILVAALMEVAYVFGDVALYWAYPVTISLFFLVSPSRATIGNLFVIVAAILISEDGGQSFNGPALLSTLLATNMCARAFTASMARSRTELGAIAQHDVLTGLRNRHGLEVTLSAALDRYRQQEIPVSILIVDIDHFKKINDDFGHETGDKVLCEFSELLRRSIRSGDQLFRYGGEEFLIVANGTALEPAGRFAEKLRQKVRRYPVSHIGYMSASIGVADARRDDSPDSWFRRADERLYQAKQAGRNRVVTGPE